MTGFQSEVLCAPTMAGLYRHAARLFVAAASDAIRVRGAFTVALAGGSTPRGLYSLLAADPELRAEIAWDSVHFFWGDERHVGPDHPDSNFRMAHEAMLTRLPIDPHRVWRIKGEYPNADAAAQEYESDLLKAFGAGTAGRAGQAGEAGQAGAVPRLDLVLLGMGPDGHTASLFPGTPAIHERQRFVVSNWVPKLNTFRITMTPPVLNNAAQVLFLVQGADKAGALSAVLEGPPDPERLPAQLISPARGRVRWLVDPSAARLLSSYQAVELSL